MPSFPPRKAPRFHNLEIYWGSVPPEHSVGHEQHKDTERPYLIISNNRLPSRGKLVVACPLTTSGPPDDDFMKRLWVPIKPDEVSTASDDRGLTEPSFILAHQIRVMSVARFGARIGKIKDAVRGRVESRLFLALDLEESTLAPVGADQH